MALLEWGARLETGISQIDSLHCELIKHINDLHDSMLAGEAQKKFPFFLKSLNQFSRHFFAEETRYLKEVKFHDLNSLEEFHLHFDINLSEHLLVFETGGGADPTKLLNFIHKWLITHMLKTGQNGLRAINRKKLDH